VAQNIAAGIPGHTPKPQAKAIVEEQLLRFGLKGFGKRYPIRLSGGQQQRVALARMLAAKPAILMLDEPFSALDAHLKSSLETDMLDLFDSFDGTIVYVSHDIDEAFRFCDRIAVIDQGRLQELSSPAQILNHPSTIATLRVSGVKNISKARKLSKYKVEACDWGIELATDEPVPDDVAYLGIRASFIEPGSGQAANCFDCRLLRAIDSRFERNLVLRPAPAAKSPLQWRFNIADSDTVLPQGLDGHARVFIPPSKIYLVTN
jgi:molybdate transport system ATP-binding protein